jgi:acyl carrier protein
LDPDRWNTVPITFKTNFRDAAGVTDLTTVIHIHDALEREFGIEIKDRQTLICDIEHAFYIVTSHEDSN